MSHLYKSGMCRFKDCDRTAIVEGYCQYHYKIVSQQKQTETAKQTIDILSLIADRLQSMDGRLSNLENLSQNGQFIRPQQPQQPQQTDTTSAVQNLVPQSTTPFIPEISIPNAKTNMPGIKETTSTKDIEEIVRKMKET